MNYLEIFFVILLFLFYLLLWKIKGIIQKKSTGINPEVLPKSTSSVQKYMNKFMLFLKIYIVITIILQSTDIQIFSFFTRFKTIDNIYFDIAGFVSGIIGLCLCLYAQIKMGISWRVGIDEKVKTQLITTGLYKIIRNPTYLGLFILNIGLWMIWPTWTIFIFNLLFFIFFEVQVRCEEDFLKLSHSNEYLDYKKNTKRYIPFIY